MNMSLTWYKEKIRVRDGSRASVPVHRPNSRREVGHISLVHCDKRLTFFMYIFLWKFVMKLS